MKKTTGKLVDGFTFKDKKHFEFEMRTIATAGELFDAEVESGGVENQLAFNGALMARQLERIGDCTGPFGIEHIRNMSPDDYGQLRAAQGKLNKVASKQAPASESEK